MKPPGGIYPPPEPMPDVRTALAYLPDLRAAVERAGAAWNDKQLDDALRSVKHFAVLMKMTITTSVTVDLSKLSLGELRDPND
jgi:hypothetical protein